LLLPSVGLQEALAVAERLRARVQQSPAIYEQKSIHYTVSIGVAMMEDEVGGLDGLMKLADQALYLAKRGGRNQVACWPAGVPARLEQGA
jgi:diguanylate cyclase (GGDEF)-like protein